MFRKYLSLFPGLRFGAGHKILQRVYKYGGQARSMLMSKIIVYMIRNSIAGRIRPHGNKYLYLMSRARRTILSRDR